VALAVSALVAVTALEFSLDVPEALWVFIFFGTITGYNFVKYAEVAGLHHRSLANSLKTIQVFSFMAFAIMLYCCFLLPFKALLATAFFGLLTFFYAVPFLFKKNLRTFSGVKIFVVAVVWAGATVIVPIIASEMQLSPEKWLSFFQRILMVIVLTLPFEIRDLKYDAFTLKTLPQQLGVKRVKALGILFLVTIIVMEGFKKEISDSHFYSLIILCSVLGFGLLTATKKQSKYFASFWIESIPILWVILFSLFGHFLP